MPKGLHAPVGYPCQGSSAASGHHWHGNSVPIAFLSQQDAHAPIGNPVPQGFAPLDTPTFFKMPIAEYCPNIPNLVFSKHERR